MERRDAAVVSVFPHSVLNNHLKYIYILCTFPPTPDIIKNCLYRCLQLVTAYSIQLSKSGLGQLAHYSDYTAGISNTSQFEAQEGVLGEGVVVCFFEDSFN